MKDGTVEAMKDGKCRAMQRGWSRYEWRQCKVNAGWYDAECRAGCTREHQMMAKTHGADCRHDAGDGWTACCRGLSR